MKSSPATNTVHSGFLPNGPVAAAVLAAGLGSFALGAFSVAAELSPSFRSHMIFYRPTGPLSGVTTCALVLWILSWVLLEWRWKHKSVSLRRTNLLAVVLLALGLLLMFPPVADLL